MIGSSLNQRSDANALGSTLRAEAISSTGGGAQTRASGWSILLTGGPNDRLGQMTSPPTWRLSGKRLDGRAPTKEQLQWLTDVARAASWSDDFRGPVELVVGTYHYTWHEPSDA